MGEEKKKLQTRRSLKIDRMMGLIAIITIIAAWSVGNMWRQADIMPAILKAASGAERVEDIGHMSYALWSQASEKRLIGYVKVESTPGYGGPVTVAVASDTSGAVTGISIVDHKETVSFFKRVLTSNLIASLMEKSYRDEYALGNDVDAISGATRTAYAITESVRKGMRDIAKRQLGYVGVKEKDVKVQFGLPEVVLIALYALGILARMKQFPFSRAARWISLLLGMIVIGFIYNLPLTISMVNQVLLGFWPKWQNNLYWFLLIGGIILFFIVDKKNPYCKWFCPFGAAQECLGAIGNAKTRPEGSFRGFLKWLQRILAWVAIIVALIFRNPGLSAYEVFGTLFDLIGSTFQFILLAMVLVTSLVVLRPWCSYLCPIHPIDDFFRMIRKWTRELWQRMVLKTAA